MFVNPNADAIPLLQHLEIVPEHFQQFSDYSRKYIHGYYQRVLSANWKAALEAFLEALHLIETHPQMCGFTSEIATQYDIYPGALHVSRFIGAAGVASPSLACSSDGQSILDRVFAISGNAGPAPRLSPGGVARATMADLARAGLSAAHGRDYGACSDAEAIDGAQYLVFPNMVLFRGVAFPLVYRFRPNGDDPESCLFDMLIMRDVPADGVRPDSAMPVGMEDRSYRDAVAELPAWPGEVYDQDVGNLAGQQAGFRNLEHGKVTFSHYQESRIRHFH